MSKQIEMVVFDMAGTTVQDNNEVEKCFFEAITNSGLNATHNEINAMMGWSKIKVFETLWRNQLKNESENVILEKIQKTYDDFKVILENHYNTNPVIPTVGTIEIFDFLKKNNIKIALTTGFYREVTDIILNRLNWDKSVVDCSVASDEVVAGRPAPFMVFRAMELCGITDVRKIIKIGDTPSDLGEGKNAGCKFTFGITNGTHTEEELVQTENDGMFTDMFAFKAFLQSLL